MWYWSGHNKHIKFSLTGCLDGQGLLAAARSQVMIWAESDTPLTTYTFRESATSMTNAFHAIQMPRERDSDLLHRLLARGLIWHRVAGRYKDLPSGHMWQTPAIYFPECWSFVELPLLWSILPFCWGTEQEVEDGACFPIPPCRLACYDSDRAQYNQSWSRLVDYRSAMVALLAGGRQHVLTSWTSTRWSGRPTLRLIPQFLFVWANSIIAWSRYLTLSNLGLTQCQVSCKSATNT